MKTAPLAPNQERVSIKALPKIVDCGELHSSMDDTADGEPINSGGIVMGQNAGTIKTTHEGEKVQVQIIHDMGASVCLLHGGRYFRLNLQWFLDQAINAGLLAKTPLDFKRDESK